MSCSYASSTAQAKPETKESSQSRRTDMQSRIEQLENMVVSLVDHSKQPRDANLSHEPTLGPQADLSDDLGRLNIETTETSYVGSAHWTAIIDGIAELKDEVAIQNASEGNVRQAVPSDVSPPRGAVLLYGFNENITQEEVLAAIPARAAADRLVSRFFNVMEMFPVLVHGPTFLDEYEEFWKNPRKTSVMWIGLLFSIFVLAAQSVKRSGEELADFQLSDGIPSACPGLVTRLYQEKVAQCLVLGRYTKPGPYTIETLFLYFASEHFETEDTRFDVWILCGMLVRLAMRMGYHRDPSHFPHLTPFQGEMRRRVWIGICHVDTATSFQQGLPRLLKDNDHDSKEPRNLRDADFGPDSAFLPEPRPESEVSQIVYLCGRNRLGKALGAIADSANSVSHASSSEIARLGDMLQHARSSLPAVLQMRPMSRALTDTGEVILQRLYLDMIYQKGLCVLHRHALASDNLDLASINARGICSAAALQLLKHQIIIHQEIQPGGRLHRIRWKISSLLNHDFLLAITVLCLILNQCIDQEDSLDYGTTTRQEMIQSLHSSYRVWLRLTDTSHEARKAVDAIRFVLNKAERAGFVHDAALSPFSSLVANTPAIETPLPLFYTETHSSSQLPLPAAPQHPATFGNTNSNTLGMNFGEGFAFEFGWVNEALGIRYPYF